MCLLLYQVCEAALAPSKSEGKPERNASELHQVTCMSLFKQPAVAKYIGLLMSHWHPQDGVLVTVTTCQVNRQPAHLWSTI